MYIIYNILLFFFLIISAPVSFYLFFTNRRFRKGVLNRFYIPHKDWGKPVWVHAASVGEVKLSLLLIKEIKKEWPSEKVVLSVFTDTGMDVAVPFIEGYDLFFLPADLPWIMKETVKNVNPKLFISIEAELWPNLLHNLNLCNVPCILINGRVSEKAYLNYKMLPFFSRWVINNFCACAVRTKEDKDRLVKLGYSSANCFVLGNLKNEGVIRKAEHINPYEVRRSFFLGNDIKVITFGCTRDGEERELMPVFSYLISRKDTAVIVCPRHTERVEEIEELFQRNRILYIKKSDIHDGSYQRQARVVLVDTIGELFSIYSISIMAFVGGSIMPFGGHNILEPAVFQIPVLFGRYMDNFREERDMLINSGGALEIHSVSLLRQIIDELLSDEERRIIMGKNAKGVVEDCKGSLEATIRLIGKFL